MANFTFFAKKGWFRSGDWVEVKSAEEILSTLDDKGRLDGLPFMPEMLQYCGKRFPVFKSAHKTCDTIEKYKIRRIKNAVHLEGIRCDGSAHDGCQAGCLLFWKKSWLKHVSVPERKTFEEKKTTNGKWNCNSNIMPSRCSLDTLKEGTSSIGPNNQRVEEQYICQATEILAASRSLHWWAPWPYILDILSGNIRLRVLVRYVSIAAYNMIMRLHWRGRPYPYIRGLAEGKTPTEKLNLQPGEVVRVRTKEEVMQTINIAQKNRGLWFDVEMVPFCGKKFRVLRRVEKIIDDKTGRMIRLPNECLILEGAACSGCLSRDRLFCPRSIYPYWHEIWLRRVNTDS